MNETVSDQQPWRPIAHMCFLAFVILASYELARSPSESLFIDAYSYRGLPYAWLAVALVALLVVSVYNRFSTRVPLPTLFGASCVISAGILIALLGLVWSDVPGAEFLLYVWKDVYIVVVLEIFWSVANAAFRVDKARWIYGLFCAIGSAGAWVGGTLVSRYAEALGTELTLAIVAPCLLLCWAARHLLPAVEVPRRASTDVSAGWQILRGSRYLLLMLALIAVIQVIINLVDYQYNAVLQEAFPEKDARTAMSGEIYSWISVASVSLQLLTGPILTALGVRLTLLFIPVVIGGTLLTFALAPRFATMAAAKVSGKVFDYSLFRAGKEILYIPLGFEEKTKGKAFIDMMGYRVAKGAASLLAILFTTLGLLTLVTWLTLGLSVLWLVITAAVCARYHRRSLQAADRQP